MTKMYLIVKLALTILGIHSLMVLLNSLSMLCMFYLRPASPGPSVGRVVVFVFCIAVFCILAWYLLFGSGDCVRKLAGLTDENAQAVDHIWIIGGFRLALFVCGTVTLFGSVEFIVRAAAFMFYGPRAVVDMIVYRYVDDMFFMPFYEWLGLFASGFKATLGIYLVLGSPHFVRWQVNKLSPCSIRQNVQTQTR